MMQGVWLQIQVNHRAEARKGVKGTGVLGVASLAIRLFAYNKGVPASVPNSWDQSPQREIY